MMCSPCNVGDLDELAGGCKRGDLPGIVSSCKVMVEGRDSAVTLGDVRCGDRVLCFDTVDEDTAFVEVEFLELARPGSAEWVTVHLADGSSLDMTQDHPVFAKGTGPLGSIFSPVWAKHLRAGEHSVANFHREPVAVTDVCPNKDVDDVRHLIRFSIRNGGRYAPLVSSAYTGDPYSGYLAVGSSELHEFVWDSKNTFLQQQEHPEESVLKRSNSAPASLTLPKVHAWFFQAPSKCLSDGSTSIDGSSDEASSTDGSADKGLEAELASLRARGIPSLGSIPHFEGRACRPCNYFHRHRLWDESKSSKAQRPADCLNGESCGYCHCFHKDVEVFKRADRRGGRRSRPSKAARSGSGGVEVPSGSSE
eukprot:gb/GFBE01082859.1/.p1 GENE.gb/GFBE01082859.1/~~gb/GFBE01082859.1/.p1  ORF type:complete len:365 (+),score=53.72 gb/GFBE01082859.1/:1-1095(+)